MKKLMSYIIPIIILFFIANLAIILGGLEIWLDWNFIGIVAFIIAIAKFVFLVAITKGLLTITNLDDHPLVFTVPVFGIFVVLSTSYFEGYSYALHQKNKIGGAFAVKASELHLKKDLIKTPYVKIINSGLGEIKTFKEYLRPELTNYVEYCYAEILNTKKPTFIINLCRDEENKDEISINSQKGEKEIVALKLPKKYNKLQLLNTQQFFVAPKSFEAYYLAQEKIFFRFVKIANGIALAFSFIFIIFKKYI